MMFLKLQLYMNGDVAVINADQIIRILGMKEHDGCVLTMTDGSKIMVSNSMDDICDQLPYVEDLTGAEEEEE